MAATGLRRAYAAAGAALVALVAFLPQAGAGLSVTRPVLVVGLVVACLAAGVLALRRAGRLPGERRTAWRLMGAASLCWAFGAITWAFQELWQQRALPPADRALPFPSVSDLGFLLFLPLAAAALLVLVGGATQRTARLRMALDGLLITSALVFAAWILFLRDLLALADRMGPLERAIALAYPVGDVFLIGVLVLVASRSGQELRRTLAYFGLVLAALLVADAGFWTQVANGGVATGRWSDAGWPAAFVLIGFAALRPIPQVIPHEAPRPGRWASALPLAPFAFSTCLAMVVQVREGALPPFLFWNAILVVGTLAVRQFVSVLENLQLRRATEQALEETNEAHRQRTRLLHSITHDLQNPLSPIQIQLRLLATGASDDVRRRLDIVGRNVEQIKRLVSDLSDVAKLQDGRLAVVREPMDLAAIVRDVGDSFRPLALERGIDLQCHADQPLPIRGDAIRLRQVQANLVSNALKFTPRGGKVVLRTQLRDGMAIAQVEDTGRGLAPEEAARLFQPFSQVHRPEESPERGTGLGLFISRGLAEAHGGTLTVTSAGLGKGSLFSVAVPADPAPAPPPAAA